MSTCDQAPAALLVALVVKNPLVNTGDMRREFDPWVGKIPWRRVWQLTPVFLPGESHGQRSLAGYSPWGGKKSDTTEGTSACRHTLKPLNHHSVNCFFLLKYPELSFKALVTELCQVFLGSAFL